MTERQAQAALFEWIEWQKKVWLELDLVYAIPNGQMRKGQPKEPGMMPGVPDIFVAYPSRGYHGGYIEMKVPGGRISKAQGKWMQALKHVGYYVAVCWGWEEARDAISWYLGKIEIGGENG